MISPKTSREIAVMKDGGGRLGKILQQLLSEAVPGVSLISLEQHAERLIQQAGGTPSFKTVAGYHWATCLCINEVVAHGIPTSYPLQDGDLLTIDIGMLYHGLHTDTAWTKVVTDQLPPISVGKNKFLLAGEQALAGAIKQAVAGNRIGHISQVIQQTIESSGYSVVGTLVGHGVGKELHEEPLIPGMLKGSVEKTPLLIEGMTIAIEVIYAQGSGAIVYENDDGWTLGTRDGSLSAVFEHTLAIARRRPQVLTRV